MSGAQFAVASKDMSSLNIGKLVVEGAVTCIAAYQKKQEFGAANAVVDELVYGCEKLTYTDSKSSVVIK